MSKQNRKPESFWGRVIGVFTYQSGQKDTGQKLTKLEIAKRLRRHDISKGLPDPLKRH
jgi:hypothetical protein